ncbi:MAG TPA: hypothetical protein GYA10_03375 [Alphaproteobacteria bacterium]|nr:hypothetical protein [Alphaproteobacteria bacterium]
MSFLAILTLTPTALAASGTAVGVDPDAQARGATTRTLVVGADIFIGDRIVTDARGLVQIVFEDKTRLVVGPRSSLRIDDYLIRENGSAGKFAISALSGTFRFISGSAPKSRYIINTPTGQIGVRGTAFDLFVTKSRTYELLLEGATINCARDGGDCETMGDRCDVAVLSGRGVSVLGSSRELEGDELRAAREWFRLAAAQASLLRPFRIAGAETCMRPAARRNSQNDDDDVEIIIEVPQSLSDPFIPRRRRNNDDADNDGGGSLNFIF